MAVKPQHAFAQVVAECEGEAVAAVLSRIDAVELAAVLISYIVAVVAGHVTHF